MAMNAATGNMIKVGGRRISSASSFASSSTSPLSRHFSSSPIPQVKPRRQRQKEDPFALEKMGKFNFDDIPISGHLLLEEKRQELHYARLEEWEMPKLIEFRQPYQPPQSKDILRFKNIHYQGESHPVTRKSVVTLRVKDIFESDFLKSKEAKRKFLLLAGPRWNPFEEKKDILYSGKQNQSPLNTVVNTDLDIFGDHSEIERKVLEEGGAGTIKISCERFPNAQMNLKWCSDVVDNMITEANDQPDLMKDIPLDLRHAQARERSRKGLERRTAPSLRQFPKEWLPTA